MKHKFPESMKQAENNFNFWNPKNLVPGKGLWSRVGSEWEFASLVAGSVRLEPVMREEEWNKFYCNFYFCREIRQCLEENKISKVKWRKRWMRRKKKMNSKKIRREREWENSWPSSETWFHRAGSSTFRRGSPISLRRWLTFPPLFQRERERESVCEEGRS